MMIRWLSVLVVCLPLMAQGEGNLSEGKERVRREVKEKRDAMRAGSVIRTNVRVSVRLKNGNKLTGVVKNELFVEALDQLDFVAANMETPGAGIRVWYYNETNSYIFLPYVEIEEYRIQTRLSDAQVKVIEERLEQTRAAAEQRRLELAEKAREKAKEKEEGKDPAGETEGKTDGKGDDKNEKGEKGEKNDKTGKTEKGAAAEEHARMRKLLDEFPPEQGFGEEFIREVERKKVVLGVYPDEKAKRFIEVYAEWQRARDVLKPDAAGTGDKSKDKEKAAPPAKR